MVQPSTYASTSQKPGDSYQVQVAPQRPFSLVGMEYASCPSVSPLVFCQDVFHWTRLDHPGSANALTLDVDFAQSLPKLHTQGTMSVPPRLTEAGARPYLVVLSSGQAISHGLATRITQGSTPASFSYEAEHVLWEGSTDVATMFQVYTMTTASARTKFDYPVDGDDWSGLLDVPEITDPPDLSVAVLLTGAVEWVPQAGADVSSLLLYRNGQPVWSFEQREGSRIELTKPPSSVNLDELLGTDPLSAMLVLFADIDVKAQWAHRYVWISGLSVQP